MSSPQRVEAVAIAHQILEALARESGAVSLAVLARAVQMTPTRVLRHLGTLVDLRLVEREAEAATYRLGVGLVELGARASAHHDLARIAYPVLQALNQATGQAAYLARAHGDEAAVWLSFQSADVPQLTMPPGMRLSLAGSACGRVMLAFRPWGQDDLDLMGPPSAQNPDPMRSLVELGERLNHIQHRFYDGYGLADGSGAYSLAAPILDHSGRAVAAVGVAGFTFATQQRGRQIIVALLDAAAQVSAALGCRRVWPAAPQALGAPPAS